MRRYLPAGIAACGFMLLTASIWHGPATRAIGATITVIGVVLMGLAHLDHRLDDIERNRFRESEQLRRERDALEAELQAERIIRRARNNQARHAQRPQRPRLRVIRGGLIAIPGAIGGWLLSQVREHTLGTAALAGALIATPAAAPLVADVIGARPAVVIPTTPRPSPASEQDSITEPQPRPTTTATVTVTPSPAPTITRNADTPAPTTTQPRPSQSQTTAPHPTPTPPEPTGTSPAPPSRAPDVTPEPSSASGRRDTQHPDKDGPSSEPDDPSDALDALELEDTTIVWWDGREPSRADP